MVTYNRPNFLASGRYITKSCGLDAVTNAAIAVDEVDENGLTHKIIKAGSQVAGKVKGLVFSDIDVTGTTADTQVDADIMVAGWFINDASVLPAVVTSGSTLTLEDAAAQGLFPLNSEKIDVTRPDAAQPLE